MSRIGRKPVPLPPGVTVDIQGNQVTVRGPRGELSRTFDPAMRIEVGEGALLVSRPTDAPRHRSLHGLTRALLANMITGVSEGFQRQLEVQGVGYRVDLQADGSLVLNLGYSHPVVVKPPQGITFDLDPRLRVITVRGIDKERVGQVAAEIRATRLPEPYRGKGVRYLGEKVRRKGGKTGKA